MKKITKRVAAICMAFVMTLSMMPVLGAVTNGAAGSQVAYAEQEADVSAGDFTFHIWYGEGGASIALKKYNGTKTEVVLPSSITHEGVTYKIADENNWAFIEAGVFSGNTTIKKIAVPDGYNAISEGAFKGCTSLTEIAIADSVNVVSSDVFDDCNNLLTYYISGDNLTAGSGYTTVQMIIDSGLGQDASDKPISGVTVYTKKGSPVEEAVKQIDPTGENVKVVIVDDPYAEGAKNITPDTPDTPDTPPTGQKGEDGTAYGKGATEDVLNKAITALGTESDPKGTVFGLLQAKAKKAAKTSVTIGWKKPSGAKRFVVYGNLCGKGKKYVRLAETTKTSAKFSKVAGKKVKKGTYYKFIVVAFDANNKVVSTSKSVHVATPGGKVGNDKAVNTAAKKNKVSLKKGKSFKLKAKEVAANKKLKVKRHRKVAYESSDPAVASVTSKGVIKGKKKGKCTVYPYAQNGVFRKIKVTIK